MGSQRESSSVRGGGNRDLDDQKVLNDIRLADWLNKMDKPISLQVASEVASQRKNPTKQRVSRAKEAIRSFDENLGTLLLSYFCIYSKSRPYGMTDTFVDQGTSRPPAEFCRRK
ncbi:hypothetical protein PG996_007856 [Apiospora saccharicola]|uniref:Uncharacterized protein n=1 Tax=Apiospora saccharicola TaxID=335842 RepID=A0ABR1UW84_9PEZI